jgi:multicomponent Na+:H+ antiporter subunit B
MRQYPVLRITTKYLVPPIILFALYVLFHGEHSPGGGFQAGVIFGSAFILYGVVFGVEITELVLPPRLLKVLASGGVLIYAGVGVLTILLGGNFLEYATLAEDGLAAQQRGIMLVEAGVGITVASVMIIIFLAFARRERQ